MNDYQIDNTIKLSVSIVAGSALSYYSYTFARDAKVNPQTKAFVGLAIAAYTYSQRTWFECPQPLYCREVDQFLSTAGMSFNIDQLINWSAVITGTAFLAELLNKFSIPFRQLSQLVIPTSVCLITLQNRVLSNLYDATRTEGLKEFAQVLIILSMIILPLLLIINFVKNNFNNRKEKIN